MASWFHITLVAGVAGILREAVVSLNRALLALKPCGQPELWELGGIAIDQFFPQSRKDLWGQIGRISQPVLGSPVHLKAFIKRCHVSVLVSFLSWGTVRNLDEVVLATAQDS